MFGMYKYASSGRETLIKGSEGVLFSYPVVMILLWKETPFSPEKLAKS